MKNVVFWVILGVVAFQVVAQRSRRSEHERAVAIEQRARVAEQYARRVADQARDAANRARAQVIARVSDESPRTPAQAQDPVVRRIIVQGGNTVVVEERGPGRDQDGTETTLPSRVGRFDPPVPPAPPEPPTPPAPPSPSRNSRRIRTNVIVNGSASHGSKTSASTTVSSSSSSSSASSKTSKTPPAWYPATEDAVEDAAKVGPDGSRVLVGKFAESADKARAELRKKLETEVAQWLSPEVPMDWRAPEKAYDRLVLGSYVQQSAQELEPGSADPDNIYVVYRAGQKIDASPQARANLVDVYQQQLVDQRLIKLGGGLLFALACLAGLTGYVRTDEATKGYYTNRLRLATVAGVAGAGAVLYQMFA